MTLHLGSTFPRIMIVLLLHVLLILELLILLSSMRECTSSLVLSSIARAFWMSWATTPIKQRPYPAIFSASDLSQDDIKLLLEREVIEPSNSPWYVTDSVWISERLIMSP